MKQAAFYNIVIYTISESLFCRTIEEDNLNVLFRPKQRFLSHSYLTLQ